MTKKQKYFGEFSSREDVAQEFDEGTGNRWQNTFAISPDFPSERNIIAASYDIDGYEGYAFVLYKQKGKLYEVNGSHCSCYGLEGQWQPEETSLAVLKMRTWPEEVNAIVQAMEEK